LGFSNVPPLKIRSPHGIRDFSYQSGLWHDVVAYHVTQHLDQGRCWQNLTTEQATIAVVLEQVDGYYEPRLHINTPTPRNRYDAGHTMFIPPNVNVWGYSDSASSVRDLRMRFDLRVAERLLGEEFDPKKWKEPLLLLYDDRLTHCAELLANECNEEGGNSPLYGECLITALFAVLFTSSRTQSKAVQSGLARWQLRRTLEYMEANLPNDIRLTELANLAGLSTSQFGRAFKASTGLTPYRWLMEQRIHRAKQLMKKDGKSISLAAHLAGFANQSHFTKAFRQVTGTTPGHWLRDLGKKRRQNSQSSSDKP
jgi:AraC family transcriptional regulator